MEPEREISVAEARAARYVWAPARTRYGLAAGWDNTVVLVDDTGCSGSLDARSPCPASSARSRCCRELAPQLSLPIPVPEHVGVYGNPPWPFWGARHLPGTELAVSPHADRVAVAAAVGQVPRRAARPPGRCRTCRSIRSARRRRDRAGRARDVLADLTAVGLLGATGPVDDLLAAGGAAGPPPDETVLSHGDLYSRHVLVDDDGSAAAIIDWGDLCVAPASVDLSIAYSAFSGSARARSSPSTERSTPTPSCEPA